MSLQTLLMALGGGASVSHFCLGKLYEGFPERGAIGLTISVFFQIPLGGMDHDRLRRDHTVSPP